MKKVLDKCVKILDGAFRDSNEIAGGVNYRYYHGVRTKKACEEILKTPELKGQKIRRLELFVAALFHDIGKVVHIEADGTLQGDRSGDPELHEEIGARILGDYLRGVLPDESIKYTGEIIKNQHDTKSKIIETKILNDADVLDHIGLINVWRMFTYSGKKARSLEDTLKYCRDISKDKSRKEAIHFSVTRKVAKQRRARLKEFMRNFEREYQYLDM